MSSKVFTTLNTTFSNYRCHTVTPNQQEQSTLLIKQCHYGIGTVVLKSYYIYGKNVAFL